MLEKDYSISRGQRESSFSADGCPTNMVTLQAYQQAQVILSTGAGGFWLSSAEARRMSASVGSLVATAPEVIADLCGAIGDKVGGSCPILASCSASGIAPGTSAMCMGLQRRPWQTSCRKAGGTEALDQESNVPRDNQLHTCFLHTTPKLSAPAKRSAA